MPPPSGTFRHLILAHKILIASGIALAAILAVWGLSRHFRPGGTRDDLWVGAAAGAAIPLLALYLRHVFRRYRSPE